MTAFEDDAIDARKPYNQRTPATPAAPGASNGPAAETFTAAGFTESHPAIWTRGAVVIRCSVPFMGKGEFQVWLEGEGPSFAGLNVDTPREAVAVAAALDSVADMAGRAAQTVADDMARVMSWPDPYNPAARFSEERRDDIASRARGLVAAVLQAAVRSDALKAEGGQ